MSRRMTRPCRCWYFMLSVCISESFFYVSIHSPLTLTKQKKCSRFPFGPNGNASLLFHSRDHRKTRNSRAAIDKSIMQSEWTNCGFHHLAHQQLFLMNYLLTPFSFFFLPALSSWCGKNPSRISKQGLSLPVSLNQNQGQAAPRPVCRLNYLPLIDVAVDQQFCLWIIHAPLSS